MSQKMMLGVPPGPEPVKTDPKPPEPAEFDSERARGIVNHDRGEEKYVVTMRQNEVIVRRFGKRHRDRKSMDEVVGFVIGQGDLFHNCSNEQLAATLAEIVVAYQQDSPMLKVAILSAASILGEKFPKHLEIARS